MTLEKMIIGQDSIFSNIQFVFNLLLVLVYSFLDIYRTRSVKYAVYLLMPLLPLTIFICVLSVVK